MVGPRARRRRRPPACPGVKQIIAVACGKGGVGKSTTAVNLAVALATLGLRVGVLDADIYGPSVPKMFGITGKPRLVSGRTLAPMEALSAEDHVDRLPRRRGHADDLARSDGDVGASTQMLREVAWGELDVLVVDMPPGTGDAQLTMAQQVPLAGAVIVSTPQDLALIDARKGVAMFQKVDVPILGDRREHELFHLPGIAARARTSSAMAGRRHEAERLGVPFLGEVPLAMAIRETSDGGRPIVASDPDSPHAKAYLAIARQVQAGLSGAVRAAPRIVIE